MGAPQGWPLLTPQAPLCPSELQRRLSQPPSPCGEHSRHQARAAGDREGPGPLAVILPIKPHRARPRGTRRKPG